jgi:hypothetical protein
MTINNSDCFKSVYFTRGEFYQVDATTMEPMAYDWSDNECPVTIIGLLKMKVFEGTSVTIIGLLVLLMYIIYTACMVARISTVKKSE